MHSMAQKGTITNVKRVGHDQKMFDNTSSTTCDDFGAAIGATKGMVLDPPKKSLVTSYSALVDDLNLTAHSELLIYSTKDWIFLVSCLSHRRLYFLSNCARTYLYNKKSFISLGFFFGSFVQMPHMLTY